MRNQATSRGDNNGDRRGDYGHAQDDRWEADDYQLRSGHHYGSDQRDAGQYYEDDPRYTQQQYAAQQQGYQDEQEYDPRAYAPNPEEPYGWDDDGQPIYYEPDAREQ